MSEQKPTPAAMRAAEEINGVLSYGDCGKPEAIDFGKRGFAIVIDMNMHPEREAARQMAEALHKARKELVGESLLSVLSALESYRKATEWR